MTLDDALALQPNHPISRPSFEVAVPGKFTST